ncbi:MAG: ATP-binding protein [Acidobacteriota bacterium]
MDRPPPASDHSETIDLATLPQRSSTIRQRFVVAISALVALVLVSQAAFLVLLSYRHLHEHVEDEARSFAKLSVSPICQDFRRYHDSGATKFRELIAQTAKLDDDLLGLAVYDTEGRRLAAFHRDGELTVALDDPGASEAWTPSETPALRDAIAGLDQVSWLEEGEGEERLIIVQPYIEDWGRHRLSVVTWFGFRTVNNAFAGFGLWLAVLGLGGLSLGVACAYVLAGQSLGPVEKLTRGARQLAKGHLEHRIELRSGDEFEVLGATLDHMAGLLAGTVHDLEASNLRLARANAELRELDKVKSDLLANVSHELRTPLTAISGYVEALEAGLLGDINEVQRDSLQVVARNIVRLRSMIDQLLSYSRMDSGRIELEFQPFDPVAVAAHVVEAVNAAQAGRVTVALTADDDVPEAYGDSSRIAQVIENLLTNAAKFSPDGAAVDVVVSDTDQAVVVEVTDRGIGIAPEHQARIFERFYQIDASSKRQYGGMGLGLAIVKEIIEMHHGGLSIDSEVGVGSTFRFEIPIAEQRTGFVPTSDGRRLLIIDDDATFVQRLTGYLCRQGWQVQTAASAEQGSGLVRRVRPEAILLDRLLPDQDGFDLLKRLRADERNAKVKIALCTVRPERSLGLRLGADAYWIKPLEPEVVESKLEKLLEESADSPDDFTPTAQPPSSSIPSPDIPADDQPPER